MGENSNARRSGLDVFGIAIMLVLPPLGVGAPSTAEVIHEQLAALAVDLGDVYRQRIRRAIADLTGRRAVLQDGVGHHRRFWLAPQGFVELLDSLHNCDGDPTVAGTELELKRELAERWSLLARDVLTRGVDQATSAALHAFFERVEELPRANQRPLLFALADLIDLQSERVLDIMSVVATPNNDDASPQPSRRRPPPNARALRYSHYLAYLAELRRFYDENIGTIDYHEFRNALAVAAMGRTRSTA